MIDVIDNAFGESTRKEIFTFVENLSYTVGEQDREDTPPTGAVSELCSDDYDLPKLIQQKTGRKSNQVLRYYVNSYKQQEFPYWHDDGECITILYYPNNVDSLDEGGETQFYIENKIIGIPYKPDRLITFDGRIPHKATAFRTQTRYTIAVKYKQSTWS